MFRRGNKPPTLDVTTLGPTEAERFEEMCQSLPRDRAAELRLLRRICKAVERIADNTETPRGRVA